MNKRLRVELQGTQLQLEELLSWIEAGTDIILTKDNIIVAYLVPVNPCVTSRLPGLHAGAIRMSDDFDVPLEINSECR
jgi:antitoxin (DNA-binding transcriptional repressor) of toxin-antitoxin stability system